MNEHIERHTKSHIEWSTERLEARIADIQHRMGMIAYSGDRLAQNERELDLCALELSCRYREQKLGEIARRGRVVKKLRSVSVRNK